MTWNLFSCPRDARGARIHSREHSVGSLMGQNVNSQTSLLGEGKGNRIRQPENQPGAGMRTRTPACVDVRDYLALPPTQFQCHPGQMPQCLIQENRDQGQVGVCDLCPGSSVP